MARKTRTSTSRARKTGKLDTARIAALEEQVALLTETTGGLWHMQDGTLIAIRQMSNAHLSNAIKLLEARRACLSQDPSKALQQMLKEQARRRVDAQLSAQSPSSIEGRLARLEKPIWDSKTQEATHVTEQVARLTRRLHDLEQENKKLRKNAPFTDRLGISAALAEIRRLHAGPWPIGSRGDQMTTILDRLEALLDEVLP